MRKRASTEPTRHMLTPAHQIVVHTESLNFRRLRGTYRGSGREKTSIGRVRPSRGSRDSVSDKETAVRGGGGGCGGEEYGECVRWGDGERGWRISGGGLADSAEELEGEGEGERRGEA